MKTAMAPSSDDPISAAPIAERILDTFPSGSYALTALLRLLDIVESTSVPSAAVECLIQPRLLINPDFVARHAQTPEKLLMLRINFSIAYFVGIFPFQRHIVPLCIFITLFLIFTF